MRRSPRKAVAAGALIAGAAMVAVALPATTATAGTTVTAATAGNQAPAQAASVSATPRAGALEAKLTPAQHAALVADAQARRATTAKALGLGAKEELRAKSVLKDADGTLHTRYDRTFAGLPVLGGDLVVHADAKGAVKSVTKNTQATVEVASTAAAKTADSAKTFALGRAKAEGAKAPTADLVRKVVWAASGSPVLAWESVVGGLQHDGTPSELHVITDATTGAKLFEYQGVKNGIGNSQYAGQVTLGTAGSGGSYTLTDTARGGGKTVDLAHSDDDYATGTLFTDTDDTWGTGNPSHNQTAAVDAHYGSQLTWDYFKNVHGRTGIRNDGVAANSRVHYGNTYVNAFWWDYCFCMTYGDGDFNTKPLTSIDVAAHEMSHGVTSATANLTYSNESGGLNEATSDIFGAAVEFWANNASDPGDYLEGEKIDINGDGTPLRYMDKPSKDGDSADSWYPNLGYLDVHYSSGPANHWFYLASEGSGAKLINGISYNSPTYDNKPVNPIGRDAAAKIWYRALSTYMTSSTNYAGARTATLQAAADLYGANGVTYNNVGNAWAAVNVGPRMVQGVTLTNPGDQVSQTGTALTLQIQAVTGNAGASLTYTATGLPPGLTLNASTGKITGTPTTAGNYNVTLTVKDSTNALDIVSFSWLTYTMGTCTTTQLFGNPGFESGKTVWTTSDPDLITNDNSWLPARTGTWKTLLAGNGSSYPTDTLSQTVYVPYGCKATVSFSLRVVTSEGTTSIPYDKLTVTANGTTLATYSNLNASAGYVQKTIDLAPVAGQYVTLKFTGKEDLAAPTYFLLDDTSFTIHN
ncbi:M4 family metallopeptidase [Streptomyces sp. NPDC059352]|uniref:M4 family metallopeptidase n=1 Tax=Streptomyces sp. NPDC059352 TaxID=3346810 RepID=UPI003680513E